MRARTKWVPMATDLWFFENDHRAHVSRYVEGTEEDGFTTRTWIFRYWWLSGHKTDWPAASRQEAERMGEEFVRTGVIGV